MADHKDLELDSTKIEAAVREFAAGREVTVKSTAQFVEYEMTCVEEPSCLLQVFAKQTGKVTLKSKVGRNQAMSAQLADHVATACVRAKVEVRPLALKVIDKGHWDVLIELLRESGLTVEKEAHGLADRYKVSLNRVDEVFIHRFHTGRFLMQGKQYSAYGKVVEILSSMSGEREAVVVAQLETLEIKGVTSASLLEQLSERLPATCQAIDETSRFILAPAIAFAKIEIELPDYSSFTHAALRGLEACIKHLLSKNGIVAKAQEGMNHFFDKTSLTLKPEFKSGITERQTVGALEAFYKSYAKDRNSLFHADGTPVTSRVIEKRTDAVAIIDSVFITLEKGFESIATGKGYA